MIDNFAAAFGPISRIISSAATSVAATRLALANGDSSLATTTSSGIGTCAPRFSISSMMSSASCTKSGSANDLPMGKPLANINVLAIPPPTINSSTLLASDFKIVSLEETFEPATIATNGRLGLASARLRASSSAAIKGPAHAMGANWATP